MDRAGFVKLLEQLDKPDLAPAAAKRLGFALKQAGLSWDKVVSAGAFLSFVPSAAREPVQDHKTVCETLLRATGGVQLHTREREFLGSIMQRDTLTDRQASWFADIKRRVLGC